ncbi:hypothetical protein [Agromyces sp. NPDC058126]|uniref:hypothetical protein n=1 Tax=Agromyces sp. NPDC058126 TaxID=3346350 RepID=UPI0036DE93BD
MSEHEMSQDADQMVRAAIAMLGKASDHAARRAHNLEQAAREQHRQVEYDKREQARAAAAAERDQARQAEKNADHERATDAQTRREEYNQREQTIQLLHEQVQRDTWWEQHPHGARFADADTFAQATISDPRSRDAMELLKAGLRDRFGVDLDEVSAKHPTSKSDRHHAITSAVDEHLAASREKEASEQSKSAGATAEAAEHAEAAAVHEENADIEEHRAEGFETETREDHQRQADVARAASSAGERAKHEASPSYPESAAVAVAKGAAKSGPARARRRQLAKETRAELHR